MLFICFGGILGFISLIEKTNNVNPIQMYCKQRFFYHNDDNRVVFAHLIYSI